MTVEHRLSWESPDAWFCAEAEAQYGKNVWQRVEWADFIPEKKWHRTEVTFTEGRFDQVMKCRCVWHGVACAKEATQEDGLCDWCGTRRPEDMRNNEFAMWSPEGEYLGLAGGTITGYNHQAGWPGIPEDVRPSACWLEDTPPTVIPGVIPGVSPWSGEGLRKLYDGDDDGLVGRIAAEHGGDAHE